MILLKVFHSSFHIILGPKFLFFSLYTPSRITLTDILIKHVIYVNIYRFTCALPFTRVTPQCWLLFKRLKAAIARCLIMHAVSYWGHLPYAWNSPPMFYSARNLSMFYTTNMVYIGIMKVRGFWPKIITPKPPWYLLSDSLGALVMHS